MGSQTHLQPGRLSGRLAFAFAFDFLAPRGVPCRSEHAPGGVPTKNLRAPRGVRLPASSLTTIASMLAPTGRAAFRFSK
ncbi:hypothetical protein CGA21_07900 [Pseudomonas sp. PSB11]|nr:hypothetical protein [Pseudomonas sp. PSB11]